MKQRPTLQDIQPGQTGIVSKLTCSGSMRRRLLDMGLVENTPVECVGASPHNDPKAYLIRGAVIALRSEDSRTILLKEDAHGAHS